MSYCDYTQGVDNHTNVGGSNARPISLVKYATQYSMSDCLRANARNGLLILCRKSSSGTRGSQGGMFKTLEGGTAPLPLPHNPLVDTAWGRVWNPESS
jgi:hypothetical protein